MAEKKRTQVKTINPKITYDDDALDADDADDAVELLFLTGVFFFVWSLAADAVARAARDATAAAPRLKEEKKDGQRFEAEVLMERKQP